MENFTAWDNASRMTDGFQMTFKNGYTISVVWSDYNRSGEAEVARSTEPDDNQGWFVLSPACGPDAVAQYIQEVSARPAISTLSLVDDDVS